MVTKLQAEVWATSDRMEVRGLIPVSVPSLDGSQAFRTERLAFRFAFALS